MTKEKFIAAAPYADRKAPKGMELVEADPLCPRCMTKMTWVETEIGQFKRWCFNCSRGTAPG